MPPVPALIQYYLFQVKSPHEDLGEIVFTKYVMSAHHEAAGVLPEKGYIECSQYQLSFIHLGEIVFTKYVMSAHHEATGVSPEKGYIECPQYQLSFIIIFSR